MNPHPYQIRYIFTLHHYKKDPASLRILLCKPAVIGMLIIIYTLEA